eukprot:g21757.t1
MSLMDQWMKWCPISFDAHRRILQFWDHQVYRKKGKCSAASCYDAYGRSPRRACGELSFSEMPPVSLSLAEALGVPQPSQASPTSKMSLNLESALTPLSMEPQKVNLPNLCLDPPEKLKDDGRPPPWPHRRARDVASSRGLRCS